jgi:hypothetical protein
MIRVGPSIWARKARLPVFRVHTLRFKLSALIFLAALALLVVG